MQTITTAIDNQTPAKKKRKKPISATALSMKLCKKRRWTAGKVEQRLPIPGKFITVDLFGVFDLIALDPVRKRIIGIQTTGDNGGNFLNRWRKVAAEPRAELWKQCRGHILLHGWKKKKGADPMVREEWL